MSGVEVRPRLLTYFYVGKAIFPVSNQTSDKQSPLPELDRINIATKFLPSVITVHYSIINCLEEIPRIACSGGLFLICVITFSF